MTNPKRIFFILGLLILAAISYYFGKSKPPVQKESNAGQSIQGQESTSTPKPLTPISRAEALRNRTPSPEKNLEARVTRYTDGSADLVDAITLSGQLHQSTDPRNDLEIMAQLFVQYRLLYQENPIGTENFEFTAALTGDNTKKVNFIDPESPALTSANELVDRWGSPFVFHPLSGKEMEILSYGPDQTLWTKDDLTLDK
ncbi:MAG: hypothetical protein ACSHYB_14080 [Roseibacillus sp.]